MGDQTSLDAVAYANLLVGLTEGYPFHNPQAEGVIGDCGVIRDGQFIFLFNCFTNGIGGEVLPTAEPHPGRIPLATDLTTNPVVANRSERSAQILLNQDVFWRLHRGRNWSVELDIPIPLPAAEVGFGFQASSDSGEAAFLIPGNVRRRVEKFLPDRVFPAYLARHHADIHDHFGASYSTRTVYVIEGTTHAFSWCRGVATRHASNINGFVAVNPMLPGAPGFRVGGSSGEVIQHPWHIQSGPAIQPVNGALHLISARLAVRRSRLPDALRSTPSKPTPDSPSQSPDNPGSGPGYNSPNPPGGGGETGGLSTNAGGSSVHRQKGLSSDGSDSSKSLWSCWRRSLWSLWPLWLRPPRALRAKNLVADVGTAHQLSTTMRGNTAHAVDDETETPLLDNNSEYRTYDQQTDAAHMSAVSSMSDTSSADCVPNPPNAIEILLDAALAAHPTYEAIVASWSVLEAFWQNIGTGADYDVCNLTFDVKEAEVGNERLPDGRVAQLCGILVPCPNCRHTGHGLTRNIASLSQPVQSKQLAQPVAVSASTREPQVAGDYRFDPVKFDAERDAPSAYQPRLEMPNEAATKDRDEKLVVGLQVPTHEIGVPRNLETSALDATSLTSPARTGTPPALDRSETPPFDFYLEPSAVREVDGSERRRSSLQRQVNQKIALHSQLSLPAGRAFIHRRHAHLELRGIRRTLLPPPKPQVFYGRDAEVSRLVELVVGQSSKGNARLTIRGTAGIGKTDLALTVLNDKRVKQKFGSWRVFIYCRDLMPEQLTADGLLCELALKLGLTLSGDIFSDLTSQLEELDRVIIVLDAFEEIWTPGNSPVEVEVERFLDLISAIESVVLMVTVRGNALPQNVRWTNRFDKPLDTLPADAALEAFLDLTGCEAAHTPAEREPLKELLQVVDWHPQSIHLLARLNDPPNSLLQEWKNEHTELLQSDYHDGTRPELSVIVSIMLSIKRLPPPEHDEQPLVLLNTIRTYPDGLPQDLEQDLRPEYKRYARAKKQLERHGPIRAGQDRSLRALTPL